MKRDWSCSFRICEIFHGCEFEGKLSGNTINDKSGVRCVGILDDDDIGFMVGHRC